MKISDLQAAPITIGCYRGGKIEAKNIGSLLLEPAMTIMINLEDTSSIAATLKQQRTVASESIAATFAQLAWNSSL